MSDLTIPPKNRREWTLLVTGQIQHEYQNYVLQTKTYQMQKEIASGKTTREEAINDLFSLCSKYALAVQSDFKQIFKTW